MSIYCICYTCNLYIRRCYKRKNISGGFLKSTENIFHEQTQLLWNISILTGKKDFEVAECFDLYENKGRDTVSYVYAKCSYPL